MCLDVFRTQTKPRAQSMGRDNRVKWTVFWVDFNSAGPSSNVVIMSCWAIVRQQMGRHYDRSSDPAGGRKVVNEIRLSKSCRSPEWDLVAMTPVSLPSLREYAFDLCGNGQLSLETAATWQHTNHMQTTMWQSDYICATDKYRNLCDSSETFPPFREETEFTKVLFRNWKSEINYALASKLVKQLKVM